MKHLPRLGILLATLATGCATGHTPSDASTARKRDGGPGLDAGRTADAGRGRDAGPSPVDAGPPDAGPVDAAGGCGSLTDCGGECVDLATDPRHCGGCSLACSVPHASARCAASSCGVGSCNAGWLDCDDDASNGCERSDDCSEGTSCTTSCGSTGSTDCADRCAPACTPPAESCNRADDDCDGSCDEGLSGCRHAVHRSYAPSSGEHFYTTSRSEAECCGFTLEHADYFWVYTSAASDLDPLYRCLLSSGFHFYTRSSTCEGAAGATVEGILGHVARAADVCGSVPLYRLVDGNDHFYTVSASERDSAVAGGYSYEGIEGYVWRSSG